MKYLLSYILVSCIFIQSQAADFYWFGSGNGSGNWGDPSSWAPTPNPALRYTDKIPTASDNVYFTSTSFTATNQTVSINVLAAFHTLSVAGGTLNFRITPTNNGNLTSYGSIYLDNSVYFSPNTNLILAGNSVQNFVGNGLLDYLNLQHTGNNLANIILNNVNLGSIQKTNNGTTSVIGTSFIGSINHNGGNLYVNANLTTVGINTSLYPTAPTSYLIDYGNSKITIMSGVINLNSGPYALVTVSGVQSSFTFTGLNGTLTINNNQASNQATFGEMVFASSVVNGNINNPTNLRNRIGNVVFHGNPSNTSTLNIIGNNTFNGLTVPGSNQMINFGGGYSNTILGGFQVNAQCNTSVTLKSNNNSLAHLVLNGAQTQLNFVSLNNLSVRGANITANNVLQTTGSVLGFTNLNMFTSTPRNLFWVGNAGNWSDVTKWSLSSGGVGLPLGSCPTGSNDNVFFDSNSFSVAGLTMNMDRTANFNNLSVSGNARPFSIGGSTPTLNSYGSIVLTTAVSISASTQFNLLGTGNQQFIGSTTQSNYTLQANAVGNYLLTNVGASVLNKTNLGTITISGPSRLNTMMMMEGGIHFLGNHSISSINYSNTNTYIPSPLLVNFGISTIENLSSISLINNAHYSNRITVSGLNNKLVFNSTNGTGSINVINSAFGNIFDFGNIIATSNCRQISMSNAYNYRIGINNFIIDGNVSPNSSYNFTGGTHIKTLSVIGLGQMLRFESNRTTTVESAIIRGNCFQPVTLGASLTPKATVWVNGLTSSISGVNLNSLSFIGISPLRVDAIDQSIGSVTGIAVANFISTSPRTFYWVGGSGNWSVANNWSFNSGGTPISSLTCPLNGRDHAIFDQNSLTTGSNVVLDQNSNLHTLSIVGSPNFTLTTTQARQFNVYGNLSVASNTGVSSNITFNLLGTSLNGVVDYKSNSIANFSFNHSGNYTVTGLKSNSTSKTNSGELTLLGTSNANIFNMTEGIVHFHGTFFGSNFQTMKSQVGELPLRVNLNASELNITSQVYFYNYYSNLTISGLNSTLNFTSSNAAIYISSIVNSDLFDLGNVNFGSISQNPSIFNFNNSRTSFNQVVMNGNPSVSQNFQLNGNNVFNRLKVIGIGQTFTLQSGRTQTIKQAFEYSSNSCRPISLFSNIPGSPAIISLTGSNFNTDFISVRDISATGIVPFTAGGNSNNLGNNANWVFLPATTNQSFASGLGPDVVTCEQPYAISSQNFGPYQAIRWSNGSSLSDLAVTTSGLYTATVNYAANGGCSFVDQILVTILPKPTTPIISGPTVVGTNQTNVGYSTASAPGIQYNWTIPGFTVLNSPSTGSSINVNFSNFTTGSFNIAAASTTPGCVSISSLRVSVATSTSTGTTTGTTTGSFGGTYTLPNQTVLCTNPTFIVPIQTTSLSSGIIGMNLCLNYDPTLVTPTGSYTIGGVVTQGNQNWATCYTNTLTSGLLRSAISYTGLAPATASFAGPGTIVAYEFSFLPGTPFNSTANFAICQIVEGYQETYAIVSVPGLAAVEFKNNYDLYGSSINAITNEPLRYDNLAPTQYNLTKIAGSAMGCASVSSNFTFTNTTGSFVHDIRNGNYLHVERDIPGDFYQTTTTAIVMPVINGADASLASDISINLYAPSPLQLIAADVNMDGMVLANDATLITRRATNLILEYPQQWNYTNGLPKVSYTPSYDWLFADVLALNTLSGYSATLVPSVSNCIALNINSSTGCNFTSNVTIGGILLGDVDGTWTSTTNPNVRKNASEGNIVFDIKNKVRTGEGSYTIPVYFNSPERVTSFDFSLENTHTDSLTFTEIAPSDINPTLVYHWNNFSQKHVLFSSYFKNVSNNGLAPLYLANVITKDTTFQSYLFGNPTGYLNGKKVPIRFENIVSSNLSDNIVVYPNPTNGRFKLEGQFANKDVVAINIYSSLGLSVYQSTENLVSSFLVKEFDLHESGPGVYILELTSSKGKAFVKIVIQ